MGETERLDLYCAGCDTISAPHEWTGEAWVCEDCGHEKTCGDPQWSDNCDGDLVTVREAKKGLCEGCLEVIRSWSDDSADNEETGQQTLVTDGGTSEPDIERDWRNINECERCGNSDHALRAIKVTDKRRREVLCYGCFVTARYQGRVSDDDRRVTGRSVATDTERSEGRGDSR